MKRILSILFLVTMIALPGRSVGEVLELDRVVELALERNPGLKAVEERRDQVQAGVREAWADAYPQLAFRGSWGRSRNPSLLNSPDFEEIIEQFPGFSPAVQDLYNLSVELSQPLFTSGKVGAGIKLAKLVVGVNEAQIGTTRLDAGLIAAEAYFRLLEAHAALETIEIQRQTREESLDVVEARYELGDATRLEQLQAQAALAELEPLVDEARGGVEVRKIQLRSVLDLSRDFPLEVAEMKGPLPAVPTRERALTHAFEHRPEFDDLELQHQALGKQKTITRADTLPRVDLNGFYGHTTRYYHNLNDTLYSDWAIGIGLRWEFFDGGRRKGKVAGIDSQQDQVEWLQADLENRVEQEVEQALTEYVTALSRWQAAEFSAKASREANRVAQESYQEGVALQADWLTAQERDIQAEFVLVQSFYDARISAARLGRAVGLQPDVAWKFTGEEESEGS
ncbi:MAG: TolC family protein [Thermoanaerobaculia bacterium]